MILPQSWSLIVKGNSFAYRFYILIPLILYFLNTL